MENTAILTEFARDVIEGLSSNPKYLYSKYFYDNRGSKIFERIMRMPEYYLTDCELEIFQKQKSAICDEFNPDNGAFEMIELGAGDGLKTRILLEELLHQKHNFRYIPFDISALAIENLQSKLQNEMPDLNTDGRTGDYFQLIAGLNGSKPKVVLFLGSNIGNFTRKESVSFLKQLRAVLNKGDKLLIGFDLKKDPETILKAYNDPHGLTAEFNLNLLRRINRELGADFNLADFYHKETYDPNTGTAKSFLVSKKDQSVISHKLEESFRFAENESIFMEMSQKYNEEMILNLANESGFSIVRNYYDSHRWFINSLWAL